MALAKRVVLFLLVNAFSEERAVPANLKTLMISEARSPLMTLFASHPSLDDRIARLMNISAKT